MKKEKWLLLVISLMLFFTGHVTDEQTGESLIGVSVRNQTTGGGAATDKNGYFRLRVQSNAVVVINYIGYNSQTLNTWDKKMMGY